MSDTREHDQDPVQDLRLNKYIASCGVCSRREADRLIDDGQVTVNGRCAVQGMIVQAGDTVKVKGKLISLPENKIVVAYYKPAGVTCTAGDPHARKTLKDVFSYPVRLTYAGRLDQDSEGLLLMTNDGDLIDRMMRGSAGHEKEYIVRVRRKISDQDLRQMEKGIWLKDLEVKTAPCRIKRLGEYTFSIVLTQGLNRQIRRMVKAVGNEIRFLKRTRVLTVKLEDMKPGEQRTLSAAQLKELYDAAYERR